MIKNNTLRSQGGFTLVEAMIMIVILGILFAITIPAYSGYMQRTRIQGARNRLIADLQYARSIAISRRTTFRVDFNGTDYEIIQPGPDTVIRSSTAPPGVSITADVNPQFFPWGLADAASITVNGNGMVSNINLLPNGAVYHD